MRIEGEYTFKAPREVVFDLLQDPQMLAGAMPGATSITQVGEDTYEAEMTVKVGAISGKYGGTISVEDARRPEYFRLTVEGRGAAGFLKGEGSVDLENVTEGTLIRYAGETQVGGRIAQVGQRLIQSVARKMIDQGLRSLEAEIDKRQEGGEAAGDSG